MRRDRFSTLSKHMRVYNGPPGIATVAGSGSDAIIAHAGNDWIIGHPTNDPAINKTRTYYSANFGIVGGAAVDESTNILNMIATVGAEGGGKIIIAPLTGGDPIHFGNLASIYANDLDIEFIGSQTMGASGGLRVMGAMDEFVRAPATNAGKLHLSFPAVEGDVSITLSSSASAMQASDFLDGDLVTIRGENDISGKPKQKQIVTILSRDTVANTLTFAEALEYDFEPTYPSSAWVPDHTTGTTIYVNRACSFTVDVARGTMTTTVNNPSNIAVGDMVRAYDSRVEIDLNAAAIRGSGLPYENECRLEYLIVTELNTTTGVVTFDRPLSKDYKAGTPYFGGIAKVLPVENVHIRGMNVTFTATQTNKNTHAISLNFAKDCKMVDCYVDGSGGAKGQMFRISDSINCWAENSVGVDPAFHESGEGYIFTNYKSAGSGHRNCIGRGGRHNFLMQACTTWTVANCQSIDSWISGIDAHGVDEYDGVISDCQLSQMNNHPSDATNGACLRIGNTSHTVGTHWTTVRDCVFWGNHETNIAGIDFLAASTHLTVDGCDFYGGYYGVKNSKNPSQCTPTQTASDIIIKNCNFYNIANRTVYLEGIPDTAGGTRSSAKIARLLLEGNTTFNCVQHFHISGGDAITSLTVSDNHTIAPITSPANDFYGVALSSVDGLMVRNNNFHLCSRGISLTNVTNACVIGNTLTATVDAISINLSGTNTGPGGGALINVGNIVDNTSLSGGGGGSSAFATDVSVTNTAPKFTLIESGVTADNTRWDFIADAEALAMRLVNDAGSSANTWLAVHRTANVIDSVNIEGAAIGITGAATITGTLNVTGGITGTTSSAFTSDISITNADPQLTFVESGVTANNTRWDILVDAEALLMRVVNDAGSSANTWLGVNRTANVIDSVNIEGTAINLTGNTLVTGTLGITSTATIASNAPALSWYENDAAANNRRYDVLINGEVWALRLVDDAYTAATNIMEVNRTANTVDSVAFPTGLIGFGTSSPASGVKVTIDGASRVRQVGSTRYRFDLNVAGARAKFTAYDDNGPGAYLPLDIESSTLDFAPNGGASVMNISGTTLTIGVRVTDGNGGFKQFISFTGLAAGVTVDFLPNDAGRAAGGTIFGSFRHSTLANSSGRLTGVFYSGTPYNDFLGGDGIRFTATTGGKFSMTHISGAFGTFSGAFDVYWRS